MWWVWGMWRQAILAVAGRAARRCLLVLSLPYEALRLPRTLLERLARRAHRSIGEPQPKADEDEAAGGEPEPIAGELEPEGEKAEPIAEELDPEPRESEPIGTRQLELHVSTLFLRQVLEQLTPGPDEELAAITGVAVSERTFVPSVIVPLEYEEVSEVGVTADGLSVLRQMGAVSREGMLLMVLAHSHPGDGPGAVMPSHVDLETQERLERAGYQAVSAIFSRDGHFGFFSVDLPFRVRVHGTGIDEVGEHVWKLRVRGEVGAVQGARDWAWTGEAE